MFCPCASQFVYRSTENGGLHYVKSFANFMLRDDKIILDNFSNKGLFRNFQL